jgi:glutamine amidotransferase
MITIIDIGMGNLQSISNMLARLKVKSMISCNIGDIEKAEKLILPGVGSFDNAMNSLNKNNLIPVLSKRVITDRIPILGICLGIQLFSKKSEEGNLPGLGWIDAETVRFQFNAKQNMKIPHMGWNTVIVKDKESLFKGMNGEIRFYFVHSYYLKCNNEEDILSLTPYGFDFISAIHRDNIYGTQFHPEKSHKFGMQLLNNFVENA